MGFGNSFAMISWAVAASIPLLADNKSQFRVRAVCRASSSDRTRLLPGAGAPDFGGLDGCPRAAEKSTTHKIKDAKARPRPADTNAAKKLRW